MKWLTRLLDRKTRLDTHAYEADRWGTCAVGEFHNHLPGVIRYRGGIFNTNPVPEDSTIRELGSRFAIAVRRNNRTIALKLYRQIERRVITLAKSG